MRQNARAEIAAIVQRQLAPVNDYLAKLMAALAGVSNEMASAIEKIQPASVDLTQEMADDIVRKIHGPLTLTKEFSDELRQLVGSADWYQMFPFGYGGPGSGRLELRVKADGTIHLQIQDFEGIRRWQGTLVPPDYGVTDERG